MQITEEITMDAFAVEEVPPPQEAVDREELANLAFWHWEMRGFPEDRPEQDWFWAEEELRRVRYAERLAGGYEAE